MQRDKKEMFEQLCTVGTQLDKAVQAEDTMLFMKLVNDHQDVVAFLRYYIEESFITALSLKHTDLVEFMLVNGLDISSGKL